MEIDLSLLAEAEGFGLQAADLLPPKPEPKPEPEKPKPKPEPKQRPKPPRKKPGDKIGVFTVVRDTGESNPKGGAALYELECPFCGQTRVMDAHYAGKLKSCSCQKFRLEGEAASRARAEEADLRMMRKWRGVYCSPESASLVFTNVRRPGKLALYADMGKRDREMLAETLSAQQPPTDMPWKDWGKLNALESLTGERFLEILDLLQKDQIAFPARDVIVRADKAVELWLRLKDGQSFDSMAREFGTTTKKVICTLYAVSVRLQITAFVEHKYGAHAPWKTPFRDETWGTWETVEQLHEKLYAAMCDAGERATAEHWKKVISDVLARLEKQTYLLGI